MKNTTPALTAFILILCSCSLFSQDTLYMKNGTKIATKILEITPTEIKYKKMDNIDGPTFTTHGSDISLVKYQNGTFDTIKVDPSVKVAVKTPKATTPPPPPDPHPAIYRQGPVFKYDRRHINAKEAQRIMLTVNDPEINDLVKQAKFAKGMGFLGFVAIPTFIFGAGYTAVALINNNGSPYDMAYWPGITSGVVAVGCLGTAITFNVKKKKNINAALEIYNQKY